jgi:hypothetical protein
MNESRTESGSGRLPYPHARNDCTICRERDADVQVLAMGAENYGTPSWPSLMCGNCLGHHIALRAFHLTGDFCDQPFTVTVALAPGRRP